MKTPDTERATRLANIDQQRAGAEDALDVLIAAWRECHEPGDNDTMHVTLVAAQIEGAGLHTPRVDRGGVLKAMVMLAVAVERLATMKVGDH